MGFYLRVDCEASYLADYEFALPKAWSDNRNLPSFLEGIPKQEGCDYVALSRLPTPPGGRELRSKDIRYELYLIIEGRET